MLGIEQKKGNPNKLQGKLIVYAKISSDAELEKGMLPLRDMVRNGLLVVSGEFKPNESFKDFIRREVNSNSNTEGLSELIEHLKEEGMDLPDNLDPESFKDRIQEISNMEIIPVPAKVVFYETEEEILKEDADIYYIGTFSGIGQAHLCITSLPIFYQAMYREQVNSWERQYINDLLGQIENGDSKESENNLSNVDVFSEHESLDTFMGNLWELLGIRIIPFLLAQETDEDYENNIRKFYSFMSSYPEIEDVVQMDHSIRLLRQNKGDPKARERLELLGQKISATYQEDFEKASSFKKRLEMLEN
ncbi:MAG: hypothetical protein GX545_01755 [Fibrobacter sp.]|jgi:hypothetical protein|nr:hypothetical protein [Fibrobacter sp.]